MDVGRRDAYNAGQLFPSSPRFSRLLFTTPEANDNDEEDTNVLTKAVFDDIWDVAKKVTSLVYELKLLGFWRVESRVLLCPPYARRNLS